MVMKDQENSKRLENGDVIRVYRKSFHYDHYGIYVAMGNKVIHYTTPKEDAGGVFKDSGICGDSCGVVRETSLDEFLDGAESFEVCRYPEEEPWRPLLCFMRETFKVRRDEVKGNRAPFCEIDQDSQGGKAVQKAKSLLGEKKYNLVWNNCEHFAVFCRYNYRASGQVQGWGTVVVASIVLVLTVPLAFLGLGKARNKDSDS